MITNVIWVILVTSAALAVCGAIAWVCERVEAKFHAWQLRKTKQRAREALLVGRRNSFFSDGAIQR